MNTLSKNLKCLIAVMAMAGAPLAVASDVEWSISVGSGGYGPQVYTPPPAVVYTPPPVVYYRRVVPTVEYQTYYYAPPPHWRGYDNRGHGRHHHHGRHHKHDRHDRHDHQDHRGFRR